MLSELLDFIFPKTSILSGERISVSNSNQYVIDGEIELIPKVTSEDLRDLQNKLISDFSFSLFRFKDGDDFSKIIYHLKYGQMKRLGIYLGDLFGKELKYFLNSQNLNFDFIVPVPLYKTKERERGYNQSDYLCRGIIRQINTTLSKNFVARNRHTSTQTKLSREERISNMNGAFGCNTKFIDLIVGKNIILVDDVVTTGSTMNEVIKVLKGNGCGKVLACSLAMAR